MIFFQHSNTSLERWGEVEAEVKRHFEEAHLSEAFVDRRTYAIPQSTVSSLSTAFTSLEKCAFEVTQPIQYVDYRDDDVHLPKNDPLF